MAVICLVDIAEFEMLVSLSTCNKAAGVSKITKEMFKYGISEKLIDILKFIFEIIVNFKVMPKDFDVGLVDLLVKDNKKDTNDINNLRPLTISDALAILFEKIILNELSCRLDKDEAGIIVGNMKINNILHADDIILICNNVFEMNKMLEITENYGKKYEIKFNPNKTNYIIFFDKQLSNQKEFIIDIQPVFQGEVVKRVEAIKYLGVWLDEQINFKNQLKKERDYLHTATNKW
ncbi:unnamed protein product, partial [Brachionus calyciflorus]